MATRKLKYIPYGQATIIDYENGNVLLRSYDTIVAEIKDGNVYCYGLYSRTTIKHLSAFAKEFGFEYSDLKKCYKDKCTYYIKEKLFVSLVTGEILGE